MSLEAFKASGILRILTPDLAIDRFKRMQARMPVEHLIKMLDPRRSLSTTRRSWRRRRCRRSPERAAAVTLASE